MTAVRCLTYCLLGALIGPCAYVLAQPQERENLPAISNPCEVSALSKLNPIVGGETELGVTIRMIRNRNIIRIVYEKQLFHKIKVDIDLKKVVAARITHNVSKILLTTNDGKNYVIDATTGATLKTLKVSENIFAAFPALYPREKESIFQISQDLNHLLVTSKSAQFSTLSMLSLNTGEVEYQLQYPRWGNWVESAVFSERSNKILLQIKSLFALDQLAVVDLATHELRNIEAEGFRFLTGRQATDIKDTGHFVGSITDKEDVVFLDLNNGKHFHFQPEGERLFAFGFGKANRVFTVNVKDELTIWELDVPFRFGSQVTGKPIFKAEGAVLAWFSADKSSLLFNGPNGLYRWDNRTGAVQMLHDGGRD